MSDNSFVNFFNKCNEENRIPSSLEIFDELKNYGIFEGTELRRRDAVNLMAVSNLIESVWGLLGKNDVDERPYGQIPEITGGSTYFPCVESIGELMLEAFEKFSPGGIKVKAAGGVFLNKGDSNLDVIFKNVECYLEKVHNEKYPNSFYSGPYHECVACKAYDIYKCYDIIPDVKNLAVTYANMFMESKSIQEKLGHQVKPITIIKVPAETFKSE